MTDPVRLGTEILRICSDFDLLVAQGLTPDAAVQSLREASGKHYFANIIDTVAAVYRDWFEYKTITVKTDVLNDRMVFNEDLLTVSGTLLVTKGSPLTQSLLLRLQTYSDRRLLPSVAPSYHYLTWHSFVVSRKRVIMHAISKSFMRILHTYPTRSEDPYLSGNRAVLGREKADVDLTPDLQVSQIHARITFEDGRFWIEDLGSRNGTFVNNTRIIAKSPLSPTDRIFLGETQIEILPETEVRGTGKTVAKIAVKGAEIEASGKNAVSPQVAIERRLAALYELGATVASAESSERLFDKIIEQLLRAVPMGQRAALLITDEGQLLLKAHYPDGQPSTSLSLAQQAMDERSGFAVGPNRRERDAGRQYCSE